MKPLLFCVGGVIFLILLLEFFGLRWNSSHSMPYLVYRLLPVSPVERGMVVFACPEPGVLQETARQRGYIGYSFRCDGGFSPVIKKVVAVPGDQVRFTADGAVMVNAVVLENSQRQRSDSNGLPLPADLPEAGEVPAGRVWVMSDYNNRSWDSRYFGSIPAEYILGMAKPLF